jgi:flagellar hook-basal body complex protein FliE
MAAIIPIAGFAPIMPIAPIGAPAASAGSDATSGAAAGGSFSQVLSNALSSVEGAQASADAVSQMAAIGKADPIDVLTATTEAQLMVQTATVVRNRAVEAFNEIMRMQV